MTQENQDPNEPVFYVSGRLAVALTDLVEQLAGLLEDVRTGLTPANVAKAVGDEAVRRGFGVLQTVANLATHQQPAADEAEPPKKPTRKR